jgi:hypothetical protein
MHPSWHHRRLSDRLPRSRPRRIACGAVAILALAAYPAMVGATSLANAGGDSIRAGIKNPPSGGYYNTTQIWADNASWGTRQSNLGTGGAAIYGCRSPEGGVSCLDADNLRGGTAFDFITTGKRGGTITVGSSTAAPFTTNGHGEATGLNANYLQGKTASEFASTGQLLFADVAPGPKLGATRGATTVTQKELVYTVTFGTTNLSQCSLTASPQGASISGSLGVAISSTSPSAVEVTAPSGFTGGFDLQVIC